MLSLPLHPITNLQAIGFTGRGPVWPVMGASEDRQSEADKSGNGIDRLDASQHDDQKPNENSGPDKEFPENTPVREMPAEQQAAYYRHQNRKAENRLAAFKGVTPEQLSADHEELERLRNEKLSTDEKVLKEATDKATAEARAAADASWSGKYLTSELKSVAASVITDREQLTSFMAVTDPAKFAGNDGEIDEEKVMGYLTAIFGVRQNGASPRNWGQTSAGNGGDPAARPGAGGIAEAAKRFGSKT